MIFRFHPPPLLLLNAITGNLIKCQGNITSALYPLAQVGSWMFLLTTDLKPLKKPQTDSPATGITHSYQYECSELCGPGSLWVLEQAHTNFCFQLHRCPIQERVGYSQCVQLSCHMPKVYITAIGQQHKNKKELKHEVSKHLTAQNSIESAALFRLCATWLHTIFSLPQVNSFPVTICSSNQRLVVWVKVSNFLSL